MNTHSISGMSQTWVTEDTVLFHVPEGQNQAKPTKVLKDTCLGSKKLLKDFPGGAVVKNPPANAGDTGSSPGPGRSHVPQSHDY